MRFLSAPLKALLAAALVTLCHCEQPEAVRETVAANKDSDLIHAKLNVNVTATATAGHSMKTLFDVNQPIIRPLGCFADSSDRAFRNLMGVSNSMTLQQCANLAIANGYRYFGVEYSSECYGTDSGYDYYGPSSNCNMGCSGNPSQACGGAWAISAYQVYPQFVPYCSPNHGCLADNNDWCRQDQNLQGCLNDRTGAVAGDGRWCRHDQNYWGCLNDHGGIGPRALDGTWCRNDGNTLGCLEDHAHVPFPKEMGILVKLVNDAHSCGTHYTVYRETCKGDQTCSGNLAPRGQVGDTAKCHLSGLMPARMCIRFEQQIGGDCQVSDTQTTVDAYQYNYGHFSGHNAWAGANA